MFFQFMIGLYNHRWLKKAIFVILVERNITAGPYVVEQVMSARFNRHYIITDRVRDISGWWTDRNTKLMYIISGAEQIREGKIFFLKDLVSMNPWITADNRAELMINKLLEQLPRFRLKEPGPGSARTLPKASGKIDENGKEIKGAKDDMAFTFFMALCILDIILKESIAGIDYNYIKQQG